MRSRHRLLPCLLALSACAAPVVPTSVETAPAVAERDGGGDLLNSVIPTVDHHKHLMGPAIATIASGPPIAVPIAVPADVQRLIGAREAAWNSEAGLAPLYLPDAVLLTDSRAGWINGADAIAKFLSTRFGRPYRITPVHFERSGNAAQLSGYYTRGDGADRQYLGYAHLSLVRNSAGQWHIAAELPRFPLAPGQQTKDAAQLIKEMDAAGVRRAVVLSEAFWADGPLIRVDDPYALVRAENDWTAAQVAPFPGRLTAFCSFNPVAGHALTELDRCAANPVFRGLKFSFAMSGVDLRNADHVARLKAVFARANAHKLGIVVHLRAGPDYGTEHVNIFLNEILPAAPDVAVQVAHLWGGEAYSNAALNAFVDEVRSGNARSRNLYFDISEITAPVAQTSSWATQQEIGHLIRRLGTDRVLFGSDGQDSRASWRSLIGFIPLTEVEARAIAGNIAPYVK